ncbi:hypothetical protein J7S78_13540 [Klebsiella oxytoca]|uniref:Uncharacterized protein n=1 Tax=Klebsiella oxytoca TaxID=571 RepID=A0AAP2BJN7_KLEOX|nr:hypothetical protein [Klebsiella oxytoca]MBQ0600815.1 hypothetical protein [Klebsiella oxytoca]
MTLVYGITVEPGGMLLDDDTNIVQCPDCGAKCKDRRYETCDGSINQRYSINCASCGHHECNAEICNICEMYFTTSAEDEADYYLDVVCSVSTLTDALVFLSKVEGSLLSAKAMLKFGDSGSAKAMILDGQINYCFFLKSSLPKTPLLESLVSSLRLLSSEMALCVTQSNTL